MDEPNQTKSKPMRTNAVANRSGFGWYNLEMQITFIVAMMLASLPAITAEMPMHEGTTFMPEVVENARGMMPSYPSAAMLVLPELSLSEEQKIVDLIQDESRVYVAIPRTVSVAKSNWAPVGTKGGFKIWQLHIKSPDAVGMQVFFNNMILPPGLEVKVYSGAVMSHSGEYLSDGSNEAKDFWSTMVPGNTVVVEVWVRRDNNLRPDSFPFEIKSINHYFRDQASALPALRHFFLGQQAQQPACSFSDYCIADDQRAYSAISKIVTSGGGLCTGSFLNNEKSDEELYFITAMHCTFGVYEESAKGSDVNIQVSTSFSDCATDPGADQLIGNDVKFIAGSKVADWVLLWVNKDTLQRADGRQSTANAPYLLGWDSNRLAVNSQLENLSHPGGRSQKYAKLKMTGFFNSDPVRIILGNCPSRTSDCTHFRTQRIEGFLIGGSSGSPVWDFKTTNRDYKVRGVATNAYQCNIDGGSVFLSRFDKIYEDGRVRCALKDGNAYYPSDTSACDDSARPSYIYETPRSSSSPIPLPPCTRDLISSYTDSDGVDQEIDVDKDDDGLIEICDLEGLNEIRYQRYGVGYSTNATSPIFSAIGCPGSLCRGYELTKDLDFNLDTDYRDAKANKDQWTTTKGWQPIGSDVTYYYFASTFEGNNKTISNLFIQAPDVVQPVGLFGSLRKALWPTGIKNLRLSNVNVRGNDFVGSLVGYYITTDGMITDNFSSGNVRGNDFVGGLVGYSGSETSGNYFSGSVEGRWNVGGLVGSHALRSLSNNYATGSIIGERSVGGLVGSLETSGNIDASYAIGSVSGVIGVGGLVGVNNGTVTRSYWDKTISGISTGAGAGYTTEQLQSPTAPGTMPGSIYHGWSTNNWDFGTSRQYPALRYSQSSSFSGDLLPEQRYVLDDLILENGIISPPFNYMQTTYTAIINTNTTGTRIIPIANHSEAIITINGEPVLNRMPSRAIEPKEGVVVIITVSSADDKTLMTGYEISIKDLRFAISSPLPPCTRDLISSYTDGDIVDQKYDVDKDGDGLIEICDLEGLNEIRYQLKGLGYTASTASSIVSIGCPFSDLVGPACSGYELAKDLDFNLDTDYRDAAANKVRWTTTSTTDIGWQPIGSRGTNSRFTGVFEGNGKTISNLLIHAPTAQDVGLFGAIGEQGFGRIDNLRLSNVNIRGNNHVGSLVGFASGSITGSSSAGNVEGRDNVGGLVGSAAGPITDNSSSGNIKGRDNVGGLVGSAAGPITDSSSSGNIKGKNDVGGLVGKAINRIAGSYFSGNVVGDISVGGLAGFITSGSIVNSYTASSVEGNRFVGGLVGSAEGPITGSSSAGKVEGGDNVGGLVGSAAGPITGSSSADNVEGGDYVGGLVGSAAGPITDSSSSGNIKGKNDVGGLVGKAINRIAGSYFSGNVTGNGSVGGLVGFMQGRIENSYAVSSVEGNRFVGGLAGFIISGSIVNSYAASSVVGNDFVGGLVSFNDGTAARSYWDITISRIRTGDGSGYTTEQLQSPTAATGIYSNWSSKVWDFGTSRQYPALRYSQSSSFSGNLLPEQRYVLDDLILENGILSPPFNYMQTTYTAVVNTTGVRIIPIANHSEAIITIDGEQVLNRMPSKAIEPEEGVVVIITVSSADDGTTMTVYEISISEITRTANEINLNVQVKILLEGLMR